MTGSDADRGEVREARRWWVLSFQLPAQPAYARVKIWRRLQAVGAASFKNALYLMPATEEALEDFEWTLREVRDAGGEGLILDARAMQGFTDDEIIAIFDSAREEQYRALAEEIRAYIARFDRNCERPTTEETAAQYTRFHTRISAVEAIDFFQANGREQVRALLRELQPDNAGIDAPGDEPAMESGKLTSLKGRIWVTRANVHVDRMASAWLIRRWIDSEAHFKFVGERHYRPMADEIRFDMYEAEFTHEGDRCTFELLAGKLDLNDGALSAIAEIIHDLDLKDEKYGRKETAGVQQLLAGIVASQSSDDARIERAANLFDDLYHSFERER
jgi:hypothetical protein